MPLIKEPTKEDVDKWHIAYMDKVIETFNYFKKDYCEDKNAELQIY